MTENHRISAHSTLSNTPVLLIPLDSSRHNRTYSFTSGEYPLDERLNRLIRQSQITENEQLALFAAVYFSFIYRLSGEKEMMIELISNDGSGTPLQVNLEERATFQRIVTSILQSSKAGQAPLEGDYDTRLSVRHSIKPDRELFNWQLLEENNRWHIKVDYDYSLLESETIARYVSYYETLLESALTDLSAGIASVNILTEADKSVYEQMNDTKGAYASTQTIHGMVEQAAAQYPDRIAVSSVHGELTYRQLNEKANQTARMLLSRGLQKGDFVTLFMERSLELIASLLGILKAGGVYVPVDPDHPEERNRYILEDTKSAFILTKTESMGKAIQQCTGLGTVKEIINIESQIDHYDGTHNPNVDVMQTDLSYIIYTSGSTGRPKGALIAHEGVVNLGETVPRDCQIEHHDVLTQFATYSFDASVWDTIGALFYGAHLYLLSPEERVSVEDFAAAIERTGTTIITILPTVFFNQLAAYLSEDGYKKLSKVKLITVAGEALYGEQVRAFQRKFHDNIDIVNVYGPTECTVCTTTHKISGYIPDNLTNIPIGKPIQNYQVYIVNEDNQLCPVHVHGEVLIATVGLAKGYLNQPEKTADAFVSNPFGEGQIYKSGDIAKLLPNGTIEYVGRRDSQIKIRGHRIEIGEIEDSFAKIPNVQNVSVICKKDDQGQNMLVGYFTSKDGQSLSAAAVKRMLGDKLPSYFVPKWVIQLEEMPISPTGKIDRKSLHNYEHREEQYAESYAAPENEIQHKLADAWQEALSLDRVSIYDDYFAIGGDSLGIIHILAILKPYYPELKINDLFLYKTIDAISKRIEQLKSEAVKVSSTAAVKKGPIIALDEHPAVLNPLLLDRNIIRLLPSC